MAKVDWSKRTANQATVRGACWRKPCALLRNRDLFLFAGLSLQLATSSAVFIIRNRSWSADERSRQIRDLVIQESYNSRGARSP